jgi:hypothetical protein
MHLLQGDKVIVGYQASAFPVTSSFFANATGSTRHRGSESPSPYSRQGVSREPSLRVWDLNTLSLVRAFGRPLVAVVVIISLDDGRVVVGTNDKVS